MNWWVEWTALISSGLTVLSFLVNIIQWREQGSLKRALRARSQATYNQFCNIADSAHGIDGLTRRGLEPQLGTLVEISGRANKIHGVANAARLDVVSFCREHLDFVPKFERPREPISTRLDELQDVKAQAVDERQAPRQ